MLPHLGVNDEITFPLIAHRVQGLKFHGEDQSSLGNILLILSACGILGYSTMNVIAGGLGAHNDIKNLLVFGTGAIGIMQVRKGGGERALQGDSRALRPGLG